MDILLDPVLPFGHRDGMRRSTNRFRTSGARHWAAPFVLAMLCLRALVPAGFMLAPIDGRLAVVLCDSDAPGTVHRHGGHDHSGHHHTQTDPTCPYAQSAGPAPLPALPVVAAAPIESVPALPAPFAQTYAQFGPSRQQSPRAPPHFA
jgi:Protein of unknown function (DUF2946)